MKKTSTLEELTKFVIAEEQLRSEILGSQQQVKGPKDSVIDAILGYSKALRIMDSDNIGQQELVLN
jgi:hypothetical protein